MRTTFVYTRTRGIDDTFKDRVQRLWQGSNSRTGHHNRDSHTKSLTPVRQMSRLAHEIPEFHFKRSNGTESGQIWTFFHISQHETTFLDLCELETTSDVNVKFSASFGHGSQCRQMIYSCNTLYVSHPTCGSRWHSRFVLGVDCSWGMDKHVLCSRLSSERAERTRC